MPLLIINYLQRPWLTFAKNHKNIKFFLEIKVILKFKRKKNLQTYRTLYSLDEPFVYHLKKKPFIYILHKKSLSLFSKQLYP